MRNQKKHGSVLENMALHSQSIQQDEFVWDNDMFAITRTRNVYDSPSVDGSQVSIKPKPRSRVHTNQSLFEGLGQRRSC